MGESTSLKGKFILDSGKLTGSFFSKSVILVCQHDEEGAFGLVVNHATGKGLGEAVNETLPERLRSKEVFLGGPVQTDLLSYVHTDAMMFDANVTHNLSVGHSLDDLISITDSFSPAQRMKIFAGYAGWGAGQLESEMEQDSWLVYPAAPEFVFDIEPNRVWRSILREMGDAYQLLSELPDDPSLN